VADEAVSALDVSIQAQILNLLMELKQKMGLSYIFISHNLAVVRHTSDNIGVMYLGAMVEMAPKKRLFENAQHPYTKALLSAAPVADRQHKKNRIIMQGDVPNPANPPSGCVFHNRCSACIEICRTQIPSITEVEEGHTVACHIYSQKN
jgi:oligopeptide/dipeptide ABC transporter ATP-binding protein